MTSKKLNLDEKDTAVLKLLMDDPRMSIADIARSVGVQRDTVKYRIERFEKRGLISKYHTIIDPLVLGCEIFMLVLVKTAPVARETIALFLAELQKHPNVTQISRLVGKYDYMLQMAATDIVAFDTALDEVKALQEGVIADIELANVIDGLKTDDFSGLV